MYLTQPWGGQTRSHPLSSLDSGYPRGDGHWQKWAFKPVVHLDNNKSRLGFEAVRDTVRAVALITSGAALFSLATNFLEQFMPNLFCARSM